MHDVIDIRSHLQASRIHEHQSCHNVGIFQPKQPKKTQKKHC